MKLKKIASLMLAGIMAVSMLAACGEGKGSSSSSSSSEVPTVGGYTATIYDMLGATTKDVLQTKNNNVLTSAFDAAEKAFVESDIATFAASLSHKLDVVNAGVTGTVGSRMLNAMDANKSAGWEIRTTGAMKTAINLDKDGDVFVGLYWMKGNDPDSVLNGQVKTEVEDLMSGVKTNNSGSDTINYYLTTDKFVKGSGDDTVTIVMIAIERDDVKASA